MATATQNDFAATEAWTELTGTITGAVSTACLVQNVNANPICIFWGGSSAPASTTIGTVLKTYDSMAGTAAKIWVRALGGPGLVSTVLT